MKKEYKMMTQIMKGQISLFELPLVFSALRMVLFQTFQFGNSLAKIEYSVKFSLFSFLAEPHIKWQTGGGQS